MDWSHTRLPVAFLICQNPQPFRLSLMLGL